MSSVIYGVKEGDGWAWEVRREGFPQGKYQTNDINAAHIYCSYLKTHYTYQPTSTHFHVEEFLWKV